tara:strand:+ start:293 stop:463 length:171 start_codon:yes stop_codon:yes gene_type:complete
MFLILKPILFRFLRSESLKRLIVDLVKAYAKRSDNTVDDSVAAFLEANLFPPRRVS